jgi:hypothetical protein
MINVVLF